VIFDNAPFDDSALDVSFRGKCMLIVFCLLIYSNVLYTQPKYSARAQTNEAVFDFLMPFILPVVRQNHGHSTQQ